MDATNWNSENLSASSLLRRQELLRRFQKATEGFGYADVSAVFACAIITSVLQVTGTKEHALRELDEICLMMRNIIANDYEAMTDD